MVIRTGHLTIDRDRYLVTVDGRPIRLTYMEFNALLMIAEHSGRVVTYDRLAEALWGSAGPEARTIPSPASVTALLPRPSRSTYSPRPEVVSTPSRDHLRPRPFSPERHSRCDGDTSPALRTRIRNTAPIHFRPCSGS